MAAINPWGSWGILMDQSWGMTTVDPWASWALCPQDSTWQMEETAEERRRAPGLPTAQAQVRWGFSFYLMGCLLPKVLRVSLTIAVDTAPQFTTAKVWIEKESARSLLIFEQR